MLFLLPLLFNPFSLLLKWSPGLYLAAWPIIIQTLGRETLITHALVLILFVLTCDISRQMMLKMIGLDIISLPLGIALLLGLTTPNGELFLSLLRPLFSAFLIVVEPLFLLIEIYLFMDMVKSFNRWISVKANARDENSDDLSSWEPPLSRGAVVARITVIIITIASYIGVYFLIQESKSLLGEDQNSIPINFNHAIAALVTLQLIAFSATIYKDEGIMSESALTALLAAVPIFIASWSYYHLKETTYSSESSLINWPNFASACFSAPVELERCFGWLAGAETGLSWDQVAKYYFGPDFRYILAGRFLCLFWWAVIWSPSERSAGCGPESLSSGPASARDHDGQPSSMGGSAHEIWRKLASWLPLSKQSLVKILLILAYTQMLIQQMDNKHHLHEQVEQLTGDLTAGTGAKSCCGGGFFSGGSLFSARDDHSHDNRGSQLSAWFNCMWSSAKACSGGSSDTGVSGMPALGSRAARYYGQIVDGLTNFAHFLYKLGASFDLGQLYQVWFARWRSNIVQRLCQSMLVQVYYITHVVFAYE